MDSSSGGMSPADIMALSNGDGMGGNNWFAMIILFALIFGWGGGGFGFGGNNVANAIGYENLATSAEVQRGFDNQNSMANQREILAAVNAGTAQAVAATNQTFHDTLGIVQNRYDELARDISGLAVGQAQALANQNECCCNTRMEMQQIGAGINANIAQNRYDAAMQTAQLAQQIDARFNQLELANAQRENAELRQKMSAFENKLQTQQLQSDIAAATAGVVRYPNGWTYTAGPSPFCGCGCGYGNI